VNDVEMNETEMAMKRLSSKARSIGTYWR
jgi:hypothetical protein